MTCWLRFLADALERIAEGLRMGADLIDGDTVSFLEHLALDSRAA